MNGFGRSVELASVGKMAPESGGNTLRGVLVGGLIDDLEIFVDLETEL